MPRPIRQGFNSLSEGLIIERLGRVDKPLMQLGNGHGSGSLQLHLHVERGLIEGLHVGEEEVLERGARLDGVNHASGKACRRPGLLRGQARRE